MPAKRNPYASPGQKLIALYGMLLFSGRRYSLRQLSEMLKCSKQTVLRLVEQIERTHNLEIETWIEDNVKWYQVKSVANRPNVALSVEQIQQLLLCRDMVFHLLPKEYRQGLDMTIGSTTVLLPDYGERQKALSPIAEARPKGAVDYREHHRTLETILTAIRERRVLEAKYKAANRPQPRQYRLAPVRLVNYRDAMYLSAHAFSSTDGGLHENAVLFAVHRFSKVALGKDRFDVPPQTTTQQPQTFGFAAQDPFHVAIRFEPSVAGYVSERTWSEDQYLIRHKNGAITLNMTATSRLELTAWVLGFGPEAELLEPVEMRSELHRLATLTAARYMHENV